MIYVYIHSIVRLVSDKTVFRYTYSVGSHFVTRLFRHNPNLFRTKELAQFIYYPNQLLNVDKGWGDN